MQPFFVKWCIFATKLTESMKQKHAVLVFLVLIAASGLTSFSSYSATERLVEDDMNQALALALDEQQSDVISADTIRVFNSHLQLEQLRGHAMLAVDTRQKGRNNRRIKKERKIDEI